MNSELAKDMHLILSADASPFNKTIVAYERSTAKQRLIRIYLFSIALTFFMVPFIQKALSIFGTYAAPNFALIALAFALSHILIQVLLINFSPTNRIPVAASLMTGETKLYFLSLDEYDKLKAKLKSMRA